MNKKVKSAVSVLLLAAMLCGIMAGCGKKRVTQYEVPCYTGQLAEGQERADYNKALFYRNDYKVYGPVDQYHEVREYSIILKILHYKELCLYFCFFP